MAVAAALQPSPPERLDRRDGDVQPAFAALAAALLAASASERERALWQRLVAAQTEREQLATAARVLLDGRWRARRRARRDLRELVGAR